MKKILFAVFCIVTTLTACDDTTGTLGSTLTNIEDVVNVADGTFKITSRSVRMDSVISRSALAYLGNVKDPETGIYVKGDFTTQFHVTENDGFLAQKYLDHGVMSDSCRINFYIDSFYGDSTNVMKATLCELDKPLEESDVRYSNFDPEKEGYVRTDANALRKTISYSVADKSYTDSARNTSSYSRRISFNLSDIPYTTKDGRQFNNYGTYLMTMYYEHPEYFKNSYTFAHRVCPGFYVKQQSGVGTMSSVWMSQFFVHYTANVDSVVHYTSIFPGTNEVTQSTSLSTDQEILDQMAADNTCTYLKSPSGICTELTLPVEDIIKNHENDTINSAKVVLKCFNTTSDSEFAFSAPTTVLMVQKDSLSSFFTNKQVANSRNSFVATYSSGQYSFGNIGQLIQTMHNNLSKASNQEAWKKEHPNWNKVYVVPVKATYTTYSSTSYLTDITNDLSLSSAKLVGGSENSNGDIEITVIYSKFQGE